MNKNENKIFIEISLIVSCSSVYLGYFRHKQNIFLLFHNPFCWVCRHIKARTNYELLNVDENIDSLTYKNS